MRWYRIALDVATSAVVMGLIGEYWADFRSGLFSILNREFRNALRLLLHVIFPILVVGGVAGELWVQFRVSALEDEWEIAQLPRDIDATQPARIVSKIGSFGGTKFFFDVPSGSRTDETIRFH